MKLKRFLAMLMSAMVMMLCFTACDDKDEPEPDPKPEPDPNEVPAPEFGGIDKSKEEAVRNGTFLEVFEYTGLYKHRKKKYETERERWYFYPADEEEAHKMNGYAHDGYLYNEYWQWVDLNNEAYEYLHDGWERYCKKKYGATYPQYLYSGLDMHYTSGAYYLHGQYVSLKTFDDSQFVLESSNDDFYEYYVYSFTGKKYDETNCIFYKSVHEGAEKMLRELYEYYGSIYLPIWGGDEDIPTLEGLPRYGSIGWVADQLGITL